MKKVLAVARWEYVEKLKSKAFLISLFLTPIIMVGMGVLPTLFARQGDKETKVVGIIDQTGTIATEFAARMEDRYKLASGQPNYMVEPIASGSSMDLDRAIAEGNRKVLSDQIEGFCIVRGAHDADSLVEYRSKAVGDLVLVSRIEDNLKAVISAHKAIALGLDPGILSQLNAPVDVRTVKLSTSGKKEEGGFEKVFFSAYIFLMMLFFLIVTSGQLLVRSVIEEKSNRIVEVLVSSCSATDLMGGKVLGLSALGLTQMGFWALIGAAISVKFGISFVPPETALLLVVYFVLGYLLYAAIFIAAGSPLTTEQEAQQITSYLVLVLIIPIVLALPAMKTPDATWLKVLTFIPLLTPTMMALRIPIQMPSLVEILATLLLLVVSIYVAMVAAGRIFRVAILSTGKRPGIAEIVRWVRSG